jgi:hypothetical protein
VISSLEARSPSTSALSLGEPRECLNYRGVEYVRDPRYGDWLKTLPDAYRNQHWSSVSVTSDNAEQPFSEEEYKRRHLVFGTEPSRMKTYRVVGTEAMDRLSLAHVRGEHSEAAGLDRMPSPEDFAMSTIMPSEALENYKKLRANMPDRVRSGLDIWVDEATHFIHRLEWLDEGLRDDRIVHTYQGTRLYSLFNTAELPGPLPD